jgi:hypothetical protein
VKRGVRSERGRQPPLKFFPLSFTLPQKERVTQEVRFKNPALNITIKTNTRFSKLTYHNFKNEYPHFVANLTYNEKRIPEANYARIFQKKF